MKRCEQTIRVVTVGGRSLVFDQRQTSSTLKDQCNRRERLELNTLKLKRSRSKADDLRAGGRGSVADREPCVARGARRHVEHVSLYMKKDCKRLEA